jgi:HEAT repeat protein
VQRWEAAKALGEIGDPAATEALIRALDDEMFDVRWLAGESLIAIGRRAILPLVRHLVARSDSSWLTEGAQHVLHGFKTAHSDPALGPVIRALEGPEPAVELPIAAENAIRLLEAKPRRRTGSTT